ncbi:thioredoxin fold domain-containing protein [Halomonas elongata]|uniref:thioredoxin domain-containing protein n=1 Tax=Halomonas elongata TaxID=2746 RepID=UPI00255AE843|nr:thioredoxin domain-containing protein [Halomonas elongata]MDL4860735.1 thioredoxin fold domain-containing protein [Halomonas elongata]
MTWTATYTGRYGEIYHLVGNESFAVKDGEILFSNGQTISFVDKQGDDNADSRIIQGETQRLYKAINKAKRKALAMKTLKWVSGTSLLVVSLLVINGALVTQSAFPPMTPELDSMGASSIETTPGPITEDMPTSIGEKGATQAVQATPAPAPTALRDQLVTGMKRGVEMGVTVRLGPVDADQTLYVFADPLCPHCQELEPTLHELASQGVRIEIFPVSVIGRGRSQPLASAALCQADADASAEVWKAAASGEPVLDAEKCETGDNAVDLNNQFFQAAGFEGTPTLLNAQGEQPPRTVSRDTESIQAWLNT